MTDDDSGPYTVPPPMSITNITDNFRWDEFACHDGSDIPDEAKPNLRRLCANVLEVIRMEWHSPIIIISGYRSSAWNHKVGGATGSRHLLGEAADIRPVSLEIMPLFRSVIERMIATGKLPALGGYGRYPHWLHVDVRPRTGDRLARWEGKGV